jgi:hypothetical protein
MRFCLLKYPKGNICSLFIPLNNKGAPVTRGRLYDQHNATLIKATGMKFLKWLLNRVN